MARKNKCLEPDCYKPANMSWQGSKYKLCDKHYWMIVEVWEMVIQLVDELGPKAEHEDDDD